VRAFTPALAIIEALAECEKPGTVEAEARLEAPLTIPANAAMARNPVEEPRIFVERFIVHFLSVFECSDSMRKNKTHPPNSRRDLRVDKPPFLDGKSFSRHDHAYQTLAIIRSVVRWAAKFRANATTPETRASPRDFALAEVYENPAWPDDPENRWPLWIYSREFAKGRCRGQSRSALWGGTDPYLGGAWS
jgi:hypothetical protein